MIGALPQQCPIDYPFAFDYGKSCCYHNRDNGNEPISIRSKSCLYDTYRPCSKARCVDNGNISYMLFVLTVNINV